MATTTDRHSELQLLSIRHWQQVGALHRMLGQFIQLARVHPRLTTSVQYFTATVELEVILINLEYEEAKQHYLDTHPIEAAKYNSQREAKRRANRNRTRKGIGKSNEAY